MVNNQKKNRVLDIFYRAFKGEELSVSNLASEYEAVSYTHLTLPTT